MLVWRISPNLIAKILRPRDYQTEINLATSTWKKDLKTKPTTVLRLMSSTEVTLEMRNESTGGEDYVPLTQSTKDMWCSATTSFHLLNNFWSCGDPGTPTPAKHDLLKGCDI
ncbi:hypothetical protein RRG08_049592 [Elysia crispata]|uniref:Uncharacterized protein n=1 Tax=Elysia crispata TaxID=231223 RepID=A0AAE1E4Y4_9GAST|nr:hypothetical protein RRG08_049592 [Elysia crispata]